MNPNRTELYQQARLHPWYADRFLADGSLPPLSKALLYERLAQKEHEGFYSQNTYWSPSGGSSAREPLYFPSDVAENLQQRQLLSGWLRKADVLGPEVVAVNLFSARLMYRACEIFVDLVQMCGGTVLPLTLQADDQDVVRLWKRFRPTMVMGSPGRLLQLARFLPRPEPAPLRVLFAGESLHPSARAVLDEAFDGPQYVSVLGSAETGIWGFQRPEDPLNRFWAPQEIVELEVADSGTLLVSNWVRRRHPLLRYDTGDRARLVAGFAPGLVGLDWLGRHGRSFSFAGQYYELDEFEELLQGVWAYQFVLQWQDGDHLTLRVAGSAEGLQAGLQKIVKGPVRAEECSIQELEKAPHSGKILPIVDLR